VLAGKVANRQLHDRGASALWKCTGNVLEYQENRPSEAAAENAEDAIG